ncbi:MAG: serine protease [Chloroflexota bacterium]|nr:serine protease [Chloroflexota bacterium]
MKFWTWGLKHITLVFACLCLLLSVSWVAAQDDLDEIIEEYAPAIVLIVALDRRGDPVGFGTGTIVTDDGMIFTNRHVVDIDDAEDFAILTIRDVNDEPELSYFASVEEAYDAVDFAILQIDRDKDGDEVRRRDLDTPFVEFDPDDRDLDDIGRLDGVIALGYPGIGEGRLTVTPGNITSVVEVEVDGDEYVYGYQTDAEIGQGNSGGLAITEDGVPFGIPTSSLQDDSGARLAFILSMRFATLIADGDIDERDVEIAGSNGDGGSNDNDEPSNVEGEPNEEWTCNLQNGEVGFDNGAKVTIVQMRSGFDYTATVIPIGDFDPLLFAYSPDAEDGVCNDDSDRASDYQLVLPSTGEVPASNLASQVVFRQPIDGLANMELIVGGLNGQSGEFVLMIEGMGVTNADGAGDPFFLHMTQSVVDSGNAVFVYQIGIENSLDPALSAVTFNSDTDSFNTLTDGNDDPLFCDNAGNSRSCWGFGGETLLSGFAVFNGRNNFVADERDAMMAISPAAAAEAGFAPMLFLLNRSPGSNASGQYISLWHITID